MKAHRIVQRDAHLKAVVVHDEREFVKLCDPEREWQEVTKEKLTVLLQDYRRRSEKFRSEESKFRDRLQKESQKESQVRLNGKVILSKKDLQNFTKDLLHIDGKWITRSDGREVTKIEVAKPASLAFAFSRWPEVPIPMLSPIPQELANLEGSKIKDGDKVRLNGRRGDELGPLEFDFDKFDKTGTLEYQISKKLHEVTVEKIQVLSPLRLIQITKFKANELNSPRNRDIHLKSRILISPRQENVEQRYSSRKVQEVNPKTQESVPEDDKSTTGSVTKNSFATTHESFRQGSRKLNFSPRFSRRQLHSPQKLQQFFSPQPAFVTNQNFSKVSQKAKLKDANRVVQEMLKPVAILKPPRFLGGRPPNL